jgi:hypothetical protein
MTPSYVIPPLLGWDVPRLADHHALHHLDAVR